MQFLTESLFEVNRKLKQVAKTGNHLSLAQKS